MKKLIIILFITLTFSACSSAPAQQASSSTAESTASAGPFEYEYYVDEVNYYMGEYADVSDEIISATEAMDYTAIRKAYSNCVGVLDEFSQITYPAPLAESHDKLLCALSREKELAQICEELMSYYEDGENLTPAQQTEIQDLESEYTRISEEAVNDVDIWNAINAVMKEAYSYLGWTYEEYVE